MEKEFTVTIEEKRTKDITVKAVTVDEALDMVEGLYQLGNFNLDKDDIEDVEFSCTEDIL